MDYKMLIGGEWVEGKETFQVRNPYDGSLLGKVPHATRNDVEKTIEAAQKGFAALSETPAHKRSEILAKTSQLIEKNKEELAALISREAGKAIQFSRGEVKRAVQTFKFASEEAKRISGETVPMDAALGSEKRFGFYLREPIGILGAITPFNFPLNLVAHKVAPAIAAGNSVVLKPASATPLTSLRLGEFLLEAGLPKGGISIIMGGGSTVGDWIVTDPRLAMISFTGSPPVGKGIRERAGMKRVTLELGSNSALVLDSDTEFEAIIPRLMVGCFANSGQVCISIQRIYVHQDIWKPFLDKFIKAVKEVKVGDPLGEETLVGPMIDEGEAKRAEEWLKEAVSDGAEFLTGGRREGAIVEPTVLTKVTRDMKVVSREVFAPVVSLIPFKDFDDALATVNDSIYGLQAGVYTKDISKAFKAVKRLKVGGVIINDYPTFRVDHMPYGGVKESGMGREGVRYAIQEMTEIKFVCFNL